MWTSGAHVDHSCPGLGIRDDEGDRIAERRDIGILILDAVDIEDIFSFLDVQKGRIDGVRAIAAALLPDVP